MRLANAWISTLLQEKGADIFRMKGVLAMAGDGRKYVYQGVHMMFTGEFLDDAGSDGFGSELLSELDGGGARCDGLNLLAAVAALPEDA